MGLLLNGGSPFLYLCTAIKTDVNRGSTIIWIFLLLACCFSCAEESGGKQFSLVSGTESGITFSNDLKYTEDFNPYTYRNFCNGGGVAIGDINGDGLQDIYLSGNQVSNKLYLNKGDFQWEDITVSAGVECDSVWSAGVSMADVNGDGMLDIYVCKAGKPDGPRRYNELFINNGDLTFTESAALFGLDVTGLSIHAAFFDYDRDGDLDCYLLNNSIRSVGGFDLKKGLRDQHSDDGNKLLRNDEGIFTDVTATAGIYSSAIGYGLGITLSDFDGDTWPDIFVSNDFFEKDYLYLNSQDGTFREVGSELMSSMSMGSMGADAADINNDLLPDLFVTEMLPADHRRKKTKTQYENWDKYQQNLKSGYHHQYARNALQLGTVDGDFMEIGRAAGVAATDWSWASLIQDFDNDGYKDIYISNGIYKDLLDKDYLNYHANDTKVRDMIATEEEVVLKLVDRMPASPVVNHMYQNVSGDSFRHVSQQWGLSEPTYSNGSAYADLDNDGDLDLVVNNIDQEASIYRNNTDTSEYRFIQFDLIGKSANTAAIGAKVIACGGGTQYMVENFTSRGFQSTAASVMHVGLGDITVLDSVIVIWPDGGRITYYDVPTNRKYTYQASEQSTTQRASSTMSDSKNPQCRTLPFQHKELEVSQFAKEPMLSKMAAHKGPGLAVGDVNGDGLKDIFVGGGKNQASSLLLAKQSASGIEYELSRQSFDQWRRSEVTDAVLYDRDNDGDLDLYMAHGGKLFSAVVPELHDVLLINDGNGKYSEAPLDFPYPMATGAVAVADINGDSYADIVIGESGKVKLYGLPGSCHVLLSTGASGYKLMSPQSMQDIGMVTSITTVDITGDGTDEIIVAGEWMPICIYETDGNTFEKSEVPSSVGLWTSLHSGYMDGRPYVAAGNQGQNSFITSGARMYIADFDNNGSKEQILCEEKDGSYFPIHDIDELYSQIPMLKKKFRLYKDCAAADVQQLFGSAVLDEAYQVTIDEVRSCMLSFVDGKVSMQPMPRAVQFSSVHAITQYHSTPQTLVIGGNDYKVKPQFGRQDASMGWLLTGVKNEDTPPIKSLGITGQIRALQPANGELVVAINNDSLTICNIKYD